MARCFKKVNVTKGRKQAGLPLRGNAPSDPGQPPRTAPSFCPVPLPLSVFFLLGLHTCACLPVKSPQSSPLPSEDLGELSASLSQACLTVCHLWACVTVPGWPTQCPHRWTQASGGRHTIYLLRPQRALAGWAFNAFYKAEMS